jgi:DNA-binding transcriptional regulator GbsR (MarR family)
MEKKAKSGNTRKRGEKSVAKVVLPEGDLWAFFYAAAQHWQSDIRFFEDELGFFRLLIDKNLSLLIDANNIEQTRTMVAHVTNLEKERKGLVDQVSKHMKHIVALMENPFPQDAQLFKDEHAKLETAFAEFTKSFRSIKSEVFKLNEKVVHSEKVKRLIDLV